MNPRARALRTLKQVRKNGIGKQTEFAISSVLAKNAAKRLDGTNYANADERTARRAVVKAFAPRVIDKFVLEARRAAIRTFAPQKYKNAKRLFGENARFAIVVIHPELVASAQKIKHAIKKMGIDIVLSKTIILDRAGFLGLYPQSFDYTRRHENFPMFAGNVESAPNQAIIIKLKDAHPTHAEKDSALSMLKRTLREEFAYPFIETHGLHNNSPDELGKNFDPSRFAQTQKRRIEKVQSQYSGIHIPDSTEMAQNAQMLLTKKELKLIAGKK